jgi:transposase-like protein
MPKVLRVAGNGQVRSVDPRRVDLPADLDSRIALIQALIPLGLAAVHDALQEGVTELAGPRYARGAGLPGHVRWSCERGSVYLLDQKVPVTYQRVRDQIAGRDVPLPVYHALQQPQQMDEALFRRVLHGLSCRRYEECARLVPQTFGLRPSTVSRRFIRASERKLRALLERSLSREDIVALVLDGKTFSEDLMVIAVGVTAQGRKVILGFVQTGTENGKVCAEFLRGLVERGLRTDQGLLVVIDGSKGLRRAVHEVFGTKAQVQRCTWHKRENVVDYLPRSQQEAWRRKLQRAYEQPTYEAALAELTKLHRELRNLNESAAGSLEEGLLETLTLHRLGVFVDLGQSLKTTNLLESILAQVEQKTGKVDRWRNSSQKQRWLAASLLDIEPRLRRIKGYRALPKLRRALQPAMGKEVAVA